MARQHKMQGYATAHKINRETVAALSGRLRAAYRTRNKTHADQLEEDIRRITTHAQFQRILKKLRKEYQ